MRGFQELVEAAQVGAASVEALLQELRALGAVDVTELRCGEWEALASWAHMKPLEQRRLRRALGGTPT